jgi:cytochrome bd-type quinol oxidase subunit 1
MLTEKEQRLMRRYEKQFKLPKWKYILLYGVLLWGILVLLIMVMYEWFILNKSIEQQWADGMLSRIIIMPFAGIFFGWFMWRLSQKQLLKLKEKEKAG